MTEHNSFDLRPAAMVVAVGLGYAASLALVGTLAAGQNAAANIVNAPAATALAGTNGTLSATEQALADADAALSGLAAQAQAGSADATRLHILIANLDTQLAALRGTASGPGTGATSLTSINLAIPTPRPAVVHAVTGASGAKP